MEREAAKASRAAKKLRLDMKSRGHVRATRKGENPTADQKEKQLNRMATKGVVLLFNAVAKAQKQRQEAAGVTVAGAKAARLSKASFLAQLKGSAATGTDSEANPAKQSVLGLAGRRGKVAAVGMEAVGAPGWSVLREGFTGLPGEDLVASCRPRSGRFCDSAFSNLGIGGEYVNCGLWRFRYGQVTMIQTIKMCVMSYV